MSTPENPDSRTCPYCNFACNSVVILANHMLQQRHLKVNPLTLQRFIDSYVDKRDPIVGLQYIDETPPGPGCNYYTYTCRLCGWTGKWLRMFNHILTRNHTRRFIYLQHEALLREPGVSLTGTGLSQLASRVQEEYGRGKIRCVSTSEFTEDVDVVVAVKVKPLVTAEHPPARRDEDPPPARRDEDPPLARRNEDPPPARRDEDPPPARRDEDPPPARRGKDPPPARRDKDPPPARRGKDPPSVKGNKGPLGKGNTDPSPSVKSTNFQPPSITGNAVPLVKAKDPPSTVKGNEASPSLTSNNFLPPPVNAKEVPPGRTNEAPLVKWNKDLSPSVNPSAAMSTPDNDQSRTCHDCNITCPNLQYLAGHVIYRRHIRRAKKVRPQESLPRLQHFIDIYVDNRDPMMGLQYIEETPPRPGASAYNYTCRLCGRDRNLSCMIRHILQHSHMYNFLSLHHKDMLPNSFTPTLEGIRQIALQVQEKYGREKIKCLVPTPSVRPENATPDFTLPVNRKEVTLMKGKYSPAISRNEVPPPTSNRNKVPPPPGKGNEVPPPTSNRNKVPPPPGKRNEVPPEQAKEWTNPDLGTFREEPFLPENRLLQTDEVPPSPPEQAKEWTNPNLGAFRGEPVLPEIRPLQTDEVPPSPPEQAKEWTNPNLGAFGEEPFLPENRPLQTDEVPPFQPEQAKEWTNPNLGAFRGEPVLPENRLLQTDEVPPSPPEQAKEWTNPNLGAFRGEPLLPENILLQTDDFKSVEKSLPSRQEIPEKMRCSNFKESAGETLSLGARSPQHFQRQGSEYRPQLGEGSTDQLVKGNSRMRSPPNVPCQRTEWVDMTPTEELEFRRNEDFLDYLRNFKIDDEEDASYISKIIQNCINAMNRFAQTDARRHSRASATFQRPTEPDS